MTHFHVSNLTPTGAELINAVVSDYEESLRMFSNICAMLYKDIGDDDAYSLAKIKAELRDADSDSSLGLYTGSKDLVTLWNQCDGTDCHAPTWS